MTDKQTKRPKTDKLGLLAPRGVDPLTKFSGYVEVDAHYIFHPSTVCPTPVYGARAEKPLQNADFSMKQTNICRLSGDIKKTSVKHIRISLIGGCVNKSSDITDNMNISNLTRVFRISTVCLVGRTTDHGQQMADERSPQRALRGSSALLIRRFDQTRIKSN